MPVRKAEKALIDRHEQSQATSPILGTVTDYTLFTPRGHYTRTKALTRYFKAMSVLGQHAFRLPGSVQTDASVVTDVDNLRLALLASRTLVGDPELEALWRTGLRAHGLPRGRRGRLHALRAGRRRGGAWCRAAWPTR